MQEKPISDLIGTVVMPGDVLVVDGSAQRITIGPGLRSKPGSQRVTAAQPGVLRSASSSCFYVETHSRRYTAVQDDRVVGVVTARLGDGWRVDIRSAEIAFVPFLSFEGATKRNRPNIVVGDVLYARLSVATRDMEPELTCVNDDGKAHGLGVLPSGADATVLRVPLNVARKMLDGQFELFKHLGREVPYEVTCGVNGLVYLRSHSVKETCAIADGILQSEHMSADQVRQLADRVINRIKDFPM